MFQKQDGLKVCFLVQLKPLFSPEDDPNQKRKKNIFKEKIQPWAFLAKKDGVQVKGSESKSNRKCCSQQSWSVQYAKSLVPELSKFAVTSAKRCFRKTSTQISKLGCFSRFHTHIFEKLNTSFSAESIATNLKFQKRKTKKFVCPFLLPVFHFESNFLKYRFFLSFRQF